MGNGLNLFEIQQNKNELFSPLFFSEKFITALFSRNLGMIFSMLNMMAKYGVLFLIRNILVIYCVSSMEARVFLFLQHESNHL